MKKFILLITIILLTAASKDSFSQLAKDYLCLDSTKVIKYLLKNSDTLYEKFDSCFVQGSDTIYTFFSGLKTMKNNKKFQTVIKANGKSLIINCLRYSGEKVRKGCWEDTIIIVKKNEVLQRKKVVGFDMSVYHYEMTTSYLPEYTLSNNHTFHDVIKYDSYDVGLKYHYITYIAKGYGIIQQGSDRMIIISK